MRTIKHFIRSLWCNTNGQDIVEYALVSAAVVVACGAVIPPFANAISTIFSKLASQLQQ